MFWFSKPSSLVTENADSADNESAEKLERSFSDRLLYVDVPIREDNFCDEQYQPDYKPDLMICAGEEEGKYRVA